MRKNNLATFQSLSKVVEEKTEFLGHLIYRSMERKSIYCMCCVPGYNRIYRVATEFFRGSKHIQKKIKWKTIASRVLG